MQNNIWVLYGSFIVAWCGYLFMIHFVNPARRHVSPLVFIAFAAAAVYAIVGGFVMRKRLFARSAEALPSDPREAFKQWKAANIIGFTCAMNPAIFGVVLKFMGASWLVPGILLALSLGFLALWRPRSNVGFPTTDGIA